MPLYVPQMPLFWLVLYILYYTTAIASSGSTALQMPFTRMCKKVKFFWNIFDTLPYNIVKQVHLATDSDWLTKFQHLWHYVIDSVWHDIRYIDLR
jgi:hypothetical protein